MEIACMCVGISSCHSRTARMHVGSGVVCTREGGTRGGGVGCLVSLCMTTSSRTDSLSSTPALCNAPAPSLPCTWPPYPLLHTCFRNSVHESPMHACTECNACSSSFDLKLLLHLPLPPLPPPRECGMHSLTCTITAACRFDV
jgi:hypothetical protein